MMGDTDRVGYMASVLVTGGAGYVGAHAAKALARGGITPVVFDNLSTGHRHNIRFGPFEEGDIRDTPRLAGVMQSHAVTAVLHFAASIEVANGEQAPAAFQDNNVAGTQSVLEAMRISDVKQLVFSSTAAVYGAPEYTPIDERHPCNPVNVYGETKRAAERRIHDFAAAHGVQYVCLRYFNAAGADPDGEIGEEHEPETHLIPNALKAAAGRGGPMKLYGGDYDTPDGSCVRDYVHVHDLAAAHLAALAALEGGARALACNLGSGRGHSVREVLDAVETVTGRPVPFEIAPRRAGDVPVLTADPSFARRALGFTGAHSALEAIVRDAARFHAAQWGMALPGKAGRS